MYCASCGKELAEEAISCPSCGAPTKNHNNKVNQVSEVSQGIIVTGYILAFVIPFIGGIVGIYSMFKNKPGHGIGILVLSFFFSFFWFGVMGA